MHTLRTAIAIGWIAFGLYWLASAAGAKERVAGSGGYLFRGVTAVAVVILVRVLRGGSFAVSSPLLGALGAAVFAAGVALAVWARLYLGRNWGMPMTQKAEPELVTSGPYTFVRHPIYSGIVLALIGTALANNLLGLIIAALAAVYFAYSATVEERNLSATFPATYPAYRARTKKIIPFVL
jgi:protein-S-isoprenylcysteine O-methyltransferase Ste14